VVLLTRRDRTHKVFKVNAESARGFWAAQQHEVLFLRESNNERGSIQNGKVVLRNILNQSCDQPIGYPVFVSPLAHSFATSLEAQSPLAALKCKLALKPKATPAARIVRQQPLPLAGFSPSAASSSSSESSLSAISIEVELPPHPQAAFAKQSQDEEEEEEEDSNSPRRHEDSDVSSLSSGHKLHLSSSSLSSVNRQTVVDTVEVAIPAIESRSSIIVSPDNAPWEPRRRRLSSRPENAPSSAPECGDIVVDDDSNA
jgi:hypothetical protein